jgi:hypothetical protein
MFRGMGVLSRVAIACCLLATATGVGASQSLSDAMRRYERCDQRNRTSLHESTPGTWEVIVAWRDGLSSDEQTEIAAQRAAREALSTRVTHLLRVHVATIREQRTRPNLRNCIGRRGCDERFARNVRRPILPVCRIARFRYLVDGVDEIPGDAEAVEDILARATED